MGLSRNQLRNLVGTNIIDNFIFLITPGKVREVLVAIINNLFNPTDDEMPGGGTNLNELGLDKIKADSKTPIAVGVMAFDGISSLGRLQIKTAVDDLASTENIDLSTPVALGGFYASGATYMVAYQTDRRENGIYTLDGSGSWGLVLADGYWNTYGPGSLFKIKGRLEPDNRLFFIPMNADTYSQGEVGSIGFSFIELPRTALHTGILDKFENAGIFACTGTTQSIVLSNPIPTEVLPFVLANCNLRRAGSMPGTYPTFACTFDNGAHIEVDSDISATGLYANYYTRVIDAWLLDQITTFLTPIDDGGYYYNSDGGGDFSLAFDPPTGSEFTLAAGSIVTVTGVGTTYGTGSWTQVSGPNTLVFTEGPVPGTWLITGYGPGETYELSFEMVDGFGVHVIGTVTYTTAATLLDPVVNIQNNSTPGGVIGDITTTEQELQAVPENFPGTISTYAWSQVSGPTTVTISDTAIVNPTFGGTGEWEPGEYVFECLVNDSFGNGATGSYTLTVIAEVLYNDGDIKPANTIYDSGSFPNGANYWGTPIAPEFDNTSLLIAGRGVARVTAYTGSVFNVLSVSVDLGAIELNQYKAVVEFAHNAPVDKKFGLQVGLEGETPVFYTPTDIHTHELEFVSTATGVQSFDFSCESLGGGFEIHISTIRLVKK